MDELEPKGVVGRAGGDEFNGAFLLKKNDANGIMEKIIMNFCSSHVEDVPASALGSRFGCVVWKIEGIGMNDIRQQWEQVVDAFHEANTLGKNRFVIREI